MAKITVAFMREVYAMMNREEISYSRMVEMLNEEANRPSDEKWAVGNVRCDLCGFGWVAVRPENTDKLECSNCNNICTFQIDDK